MSPPAQELPPPSAVRPSGANWSWLRALARLVLAVKATAGLFLFYLIRRLLARGRNRRHLLAKTWTQIWARTLCRIFGVRVSTRGDLPAANSFLAPNHMGYLDVLAVSSAVACFFVSRADAASWPLVGALLRKSDQILVSRRRIRDLADTAGKIEERLRDGHAVCVFLEGTSTGGDRLLPFLPALLQAPISCRCPVVPMALRWRCVDPAGSVSDDIAYWGNHQFPFHVWRFLGLKGAQVEVVFGAPMPSIDSRADLSRELRAQVARLLETES